MKAQTDCVDIFTLFSQNQKKISPKLYCKRDLRKEVENRKKVVIDVLSLKNYFLVVLKRKETQIIKSLKILFFQVF